MEADYEEERFGRFENIEETDMCIFNTTCCSLGTTCSGLPSNVTNVDKKTPMKIGEKTNYN